jgi:hypothetical protein
MVGSGKMEHRRGVILNHPQMGMLLPECLVVPGCRAHQEGRARRLGVQGLAQ